MSEAAWARVTGSSLSLAKLVFQDGSQFAEFLFLPIVAGALIDNFSLT